MTATASPTDDAIIEHHHYFFLSSYILYGVVSFDVVVVAYVLASCWPLLRLSLKSSFPLSLSPFSSTTSQPSFFLSFLLSFFLSFLPSFPTTFYSWPNGGSRNWHTDTTSIAATPLTFFLCLFDRVSEQQLGVSFALHIMTIIRCHYACARVSLVRAIINLACEQQSTPQ